jgi:broad specificity phosphatase PhoE
VRHGERCDNSELASEKARIELAWDPPLTQIGEEQARLTGRELYNKIKQANLQYLVLESSPFLRCLQTAAIIAREIGIQSVHVNYLIGEWMKPAFYPDGDPRGKLFVETLPREEIERKWLHGIRVNNY